MIEASKRKILIVDDVPTNITVLTEILMDDYKMVCATNGSDALKLAASSAPDLILLDIMMPEMDGYEVCRRLKKEEKTGPIPVIFLTAKNQETDEIKGLEAGAVDYIAKPFNARILEGVQNSVSVE
ncbi:MAG: response regulator [Desulfobacter sp.]|nr:MAG: response regulator [Desulfobacter sp.]